MIFVCLGTQEFQFDRLLEKIDSLIQSGVIKEKVFAQIGYSTYLPKYYDYKKFLGFDEFSKSLEECSLVLTHGGTGTIVKALKSGKKVIAIPRLKALGEHVDDHQKELIAVFGQKGFIFGIDDIEELEGAIKGIDLFQPQIYESGNSKIINIIDNYICNL